MFAPSVLHTKRTSHFFLVSFVCLSNMFSLYVHAYMLNGSGEPNLSYYTCRFIVYLSTFAKPIGLYLTLLFSIERIFTKILKNFQIYRLLFKRIYLLLICLGIFLILLIRLFEVKNYLKINESIANSTIISRQNIVNNNENNKLIDDLLAFQYCYRLMNVKTYAKILSFYSIQYWFEYVILTIIILCLISFIIYLYRTSWCLSINTKFYLSLSSCVILFEIILQFLHLIVGAPDNNNSDTQVNFLQTMLFVYNFRCIVLPFIICLTICDSLKQWLYEFFILRSYFDSFNENDDNNNSLIDQSESSQQTFGQNNHNEHFDISFNSHI